MRTWSITWRADWSNHKANRPTSGFRYQAQSSGPRLAFPMLEGWRSAGGAGLLLFLSARTRENVRKCIVAFVAAVFEQRSRDSHHRQHRGPRLGVRIRIGDGEFV